MTSTTMTSTTPTKRPPARRGPATGTPAANAADSPEAADTPTIPLPRWLAEIDRMLAIRSQFVLAGNIRDLFVTPGATGVEIRAHLLECLWFHLRARGFESFVVYDPVDGLRAYPPTDASRPHPLLAGLPPRQAAGLEQLQALLTRLVSFRDHRTAAVIDFASRLTGDPGALEGEQRRLFVRCEKLAIEAQAFAHADSAGAPADSADAHADRADALFNPIFWIVNRAQDLPSWLTLDNERVHAIEIPRPDHDQRFAAAWHLATLFAGGAAAGPEDRRRAADTFSRLTDALSLRAMHDIARMAEDMQTPLADVDDAVRCFKVGATDNPWKQHRIRHAIGQAPQRLAESVKGQPQAVQKTVDILTRSVMGLTGAHAASAGTRPRGVLFFAGPTGVGKTELAKALTRLLFGDESSYIRFDMSEFAAEHASDRLLGAPPGYVGYDAGGELTNAIRRRPFSVVLFDEIEKANARVLDKFLQILEDGRLTDGKGSTAYFSESIIVFTSNIGQDRVSADDSYDVVEAGIRSAIDEFFKAPRGPDGTGGLGRPELLNRLGDNIVVFNFIHADVAAQIFDVMIGNVTRRLAEEHGLTLVIPAAVRERLLASCVDNLQQGGRGIANRLESTFVNPLSRALFALDREGRDTVTVTDVTEQDNVFTVVLA